MNRVWILGSGTSSVCGLPTFSNFQKKADEIINTKGNIQEELRRVYDIWIKQFPEYTIEDFYGLIELKALLGIPDLKRKTSLKDTLINFIEYVLVNSFKEDPSSTHSTFLNNYLLNSEDGVINFNWDTLLESNIYKHIDGLYEMFKDNADMISQISKYQDRKINYGYDGIKCIKSEENNKDKFKCVILKLHGSLTWGYCTKCRKTYYDRKCEPNRTFNGKCPKHNLKLERYIIPPTIAKISRSVKLTPIRHLWKKAYDSLMNAKKIIFIGYSFPMTDLQFRLFFIDAISKNEVLEKVFVVDKRLTIDDKTNFQRGYEEIFMNTGHIEKLDFHFRGFCQFFEDLRQQQMDSLHNHIRIKPIDIY